MRKDGVIDPSYGRSMETAITLQNILIEMQRSPILLVSVLLTLGVIFVNGWTDAPNAIATAVSTRSINVD